MTHILAHATAIVETSTIGTGTRIWAHTHVMRDATIGVNCNIGEHCFIESGAIVGNQVTIKNGNMVWEGIRLEDGVFVGPLVTFTNDRYPRSPRLPEARRRYADRSWLEPTIVKRGASVGAGAVILPGITIGEFAMVGAGAMVTKNVRRHALVVGAPARGRGWVCRCGQPLLFSQDATTCLECGCAFIRANGAVELMPSSSLVI
jgi:acetyltransferase-like isoleucine patch superfamily enzyme